MFFFLGEDNQIRNLDAVTWSGPHFQWSKFMCGFSKSFPVWSLRRECLNERGKRESAKVCKEPLIFSHSLLPSRLQSYSSWAHLFPLLRENNMGKVWRWEISFTREESILHFSLSLSQFQNVLLWKPIWSCNMPLWIALCAFSFRDILRGFDFQALAFTTALIFMLWHFQRRSFPPRFICLKGTNSFWLNWERWASTGGWKKREENSRNSEGIANYSDFKKRTKVRAKILVSPPWFFLSEKKLWEVSRIFPFLRDRSP